MTAGIVIRAYGRPITQGSKIKTRHGLVDDNAKTLKPWRNTVRLAAEDAARYHDTITGPVFVRITFTLERPAHHYRTGANAHLLRPEAPAYPIARGSGDNDKFQRACFDALTDAKVWADDVQVVDVRARKVWAGEHEQALDQAGVRIEIVPLNQLAVTGS
jgi:crossover junction endodeoxyribonuclease RusA